MAVLSDFFFEEATRFCFYVKRPWRFIAGRCVCVRVWSAGSESGVAVDPIFLPWSECATFVIPALHCHYPRAQDQRLADISSEETGFYLYKC